MRQLGLSRTAALATPILCWILVASSPSSSQQLYFAFAALLSILGGVLAKQSPKAPPSAVGVLAITANLFNVVLFGFITFALSITLGGN